MREALELNSGQISLGETRFLGSLITVADKSRPIVEIGTLFGWSTRAMTLYKDPSTQLITVDNYCWNPLALSRESHLQITTHTLKDAIASYRVKQVIGEKSTFYRDYAGPDPALIFLEADHSYEGTRQDLEWATQFPTAIVCLHDYRSAWPGVMQAVDEFGGVEHLHESLCVLRNSRGLSGVVDYSSFQVAAGH
ncbi:MAG: class I SAM-dependent methyltransferase [Actinomycetota bacterium]